MRQIIHARDLLQEDVNENLKDWNDENGRYLCFKNNESTGKFCYLKIDEFDHEVAFHHPG